MNQTVQTASAASRVSLPRLFFPYYKKDKAGIVIFNSIAVQENYLDFFGQAVAEKIGDQESELIGAGGIPLNQSELHQTALYLAIGGSRNDNLAKSAKWYPRYYYSDFIYLRHADQGF